jgi:hypothetical protein
MSGGTDVLLDDLARVAPSLEVRRKVVEADTEIAAPDALQDTIGEETFQHGTPFRPQAALSGASMIMRTTGGRPLR